MEIRPSADPAHACWESAWLRLVVRAFQDEASLGAAATLAREGGSWTRLLDRFERESLIARAAALLGLLPAAVVPEGVLADLRMRRHVHHATGLYYVERLGHLLAAFRRARVAAIAFKGPALGHVAWGDATQRGYGDLDLLVRPSQRFRAARVLEALGYQASGPVAPHGASPARHSSSIAFEAADRVDIDLHWGFSTPLVPFELPRTGLWERTREIDLGGVRCRTLGPEDTLLHTCFRGAKDDYVYWTALSDLAALLRVEQALDWRRVRSLAAHTGARRMVHLALLLAVDVAGASVPPAVERAARADGGAVSLADAAERRLRTGHETSQGIGARLARAWRLRERPADRVGAVLGAVTRVSEPREGEQWPAWTWPVRRPLRLLRDLRRNARPPLGGTAP